MTKKFTTLENEYYIIYCPEYLAEDLKPILEFSTTMLKENLSFFKEETYGKKIKASFFDNREDFVNRIHELAPNGNPPSWATGCFYGGENQILIKNGNINERFHTLAHESCHLLFSKFIYKNYKERLDWLDESFAASFSGELYNIINNNEFVDLVKLYVNREDLPNMNDIRMNKGNVLTKEYNAYHFFRIIGRYLIDTNTDKELLELFNNEERCLELGPTILKTSIDYYKNKFNL